MGSLRRVSAIIAGVLLLSFQLSMAGRVLAGEGEEWMKRSVLLESLQKGSVSPSGPSGCTNVPGSGGSSCPVPAAAVTEMNIAGSALVNFNPFPSVVVPFGVASGNQK
uniref:Uncharacterized protein n=1 Tax=Nelumbo nucifera TaxID=4432 RepID=A0A822XL64_NELNU|nr:TPA_asm: hypothetical protein HUJ06_021272 [Nelumbo nucifera]